MSSFKNSWEKVILCPIMMENWVYDEQLFCLYVIDPVNIVTDSFSTLSLESFKLNCQPSWTYVQNYWTSNNSFVLIFYLAAFNFSAFLFFCERPFFFSSIKKSWSILLLWEIPTLKLQILIPHFQTTSFYTSTTSIT